MRHEDEKLAADIRHELPRLLFSEYDRYPALPSEHGVFVWGQRNGSKKQPKLAEITQDDSTVRVSRLRDGATQTDFGDLFAMLCRLFEGKKRVIIVDPA